MFDRLKLFRIPKIPIIESKSQLTGDVPLELSSCSEYQRYQYLKANHNIPMPQHLPHQVVQNTKDTNN